MVEHTFVRSGVCGFFHHGGREEEEVSQRKKNFRREARFYERVSRQSIFFLCETSSSFLPLW